MLCSMGGGGKKKGKKKKEFKVFKRYTQFTSKILKGTCNAHASIHLFGGNILIQVQETLLSILRLRGLEAHITVSMK